MSVPNPSAGYDYPDQRGHFGPYGGVFVAETLIHALDELAATYERFRRDPEFQKRFHDDLKYYVGRPSPLYFAERLTAHCGRSKDLPEKGRPEPHRCSQDQ